MSIWIVTTGNSDVQLTTDDNWSNLYDAAVEKEDNSILEDCEDLRPAPRQDKSTSLYPAPARAVGLVYRAERLDEHNQDLAFPLLDTFIKTFSTQLGNRPTQVIVLLTDQTHIFTPKQKGSADCPFWQDTAELKEILTWYFQEKEKLGVTPRFYCIKPQTATNKEATAAAGVDNWNEMLREVRKTLEQALSEIQINSEAETVYVSHQAGTPAISSAVQFLTISKFKAVKFLVSNQSYQDYNRVSFPEVIESSNYWQGLQIEKAKRLIEQGNPGAALELLKEIEGEKVKSEDQAFLSDLNNMVDLFNFKASDSSQSEFDPICAIKRVRQALDLAEIFFKSENYLPGVNVLEAAQETFLKAGIIYKLQEKNIVIDGFSVCQLVKWDNQGLSLKSRNDLIRAGVSTAKNPDKLSKLLEFPDGKALAENKPDKYFTPNNSSLYQWLLNLKNFKQWYLMKWSCTYFRTHNLDLRNQNLHNLLGVKKIDVIRYLLGNPNDPKIKGNVHPAQAIFDEYTGKEGSLRLQDVVKVYLRYVKEPFLEALEQFGWNDESLGYKPLQEQLEDLAISLDKQVQESDRTP